MVSFVGYETAMLNAKADMDHLLEPTALGLGAASIIANVVDVAIARETPVAVSTISPSEIALKTGNQEFPEIMNRTPGGLRHQTRRWLRGLTHLIAWI